MAVIGKLMRLIDLESEPKYFVRRKAFSIHYQLDIDTLLEESNPIFKSELRLLSELIVSFPDSFE